MTDLRTTSDLVPAARKDGDVVVATLRGEIDLHNSPGLRTDILDLLNRNACRRLVLNLAEVPYMDSSAAAVLVEAMQKLRRIGGQVYLTNLQSRVQSILNINKLASLFVIVPEEKDALPASPT